MKLTVTIPYWPWIVTALVGCAIGWFASMTVAIVITVMLALLLMLHVRGAIKHINATNHGDIVLAEVTIMLIAFALIAIFVSVMWATYLYVN